MMCNFNANDVSDHYQVIRSELAAVFLESLALRNARTFQPFSACSKITNKLTNELKL